MVPRSTLARPSPAAVVPLARSMRSTWSAVIRAGCALCPAACRVMVTPLAGA